MEAVSKKAGGTLQDERRVPPRYKMGPEGPLAAGGADLKGVEKHIFNNLSWFGWDEVFTGKVLEIKRRLFKKDECFSGATDGQLDSVNLNKKINGVAVSLTINRFYAYFSASSFSPARKHKTVNGVCDAIREFLPEMPLDIAEKKLDHGAGYSVWAQGKLERNEAQPPDIQHHGHGC